MFMTIWKISNFFGDVGHFSRITQYKSRQRPTLGGSRLPPFPIKKGVPSYSTGKKKGNEKKKNHTPLYNSIEVFFFLFFSSRMSFIYLEKGYSAEALASSSLFRILLVKRIYNKNTMPFT